PPGTVKSSPSWEENVGLSPNSCERLDNVPGLLIWSYKTTWGAVGGGGLAEVLPLGPETCNLESADCEPSPGGGALICAAPGYCASAGCVAQRPTAVTTSTRANSPASVPLGNEDRRIEIPPSAR